jgi:hypothetical protein
MVKTDYLRRYTELPALIYLLTRRKLTLLDPTSWDDQNDSYYLNLYRQRRRLKAVLAVCFTQSSESYHHWRVFAHGPAGVCIQFKRSELIDAVKGEPGLRCRQVKYVTLEDLGSKSLAVRDLPFRKRWAFEHEREYRMIYESETQGISSLELDIPLSCIERVSLSPWSPASFKPVIAERLQSIKGCSGLKVGRSTLIGNDKWKRYGDNAVDT